jgi:parvulin-like peptidyl-prolyl isomerase
MPVGIGITQRRKGAKDELEPAQAALLMKLQQGAVLKVHRTVDGDKVYRLHQTGAPDQEIAAALVATLTDRNLLQSNMKFPAATFLLTDKGVAVARQLSSATVEPTGPRNY